MGLLDFIFDKDKAQEKQIKKLRKNLLNIWSQSPERNAAAEQLRDISTDAALTALMDRFKVNVQNTTYDNEEKLYIYEMIVALGPTVIDVVKNIVVTETEQVNWPMKVLDELLTTDEKARFITKVLSELNTDYERNPEKKEQLILRAKGFMEHIDLQKEVARFSIDDSESCRFMCVNQVVLHDTEWAKQSLIENLRLEDSGRILLIVCNRVADMGWPAIDDMENVEELEDLRARLQPPFIVTEEGILARG